MDFESIYRAALERFPHIKVARETRRRNLASLNQHYKFLLQNPDFTRFMLDEAERQKEQADAPTEPQATAV